MTLSFVLTIFNDHAGVEASLDALAACTRPGDRVFLVDDGSADGTDLRLLQRAALGLGEGVEVLPILFGAHTGSAYGIAANTGLAHALSDRACTGVCFIESGVRLNAAGFAAARLTYDQLRPDLLICGYDAFEYGPGRRASEAALWSRLGSEYPADPKAQRSLALEMNPVVGRVIYAAPFLRKTNLRFPETADPYAESLFHWTTCLKAERISFDPVSLGRYPPVRLRADATGALFEQFAVLRHHVACNAPSHMTAVLQWFAGHLERFLQNLPEEMLLPCVSRASEALGGVPEADWQLFADGGGQTVMMRLVQALREGRVMDALTFRTLTLQARRQEAVMAEVLSRLSALEDRVQAIPSRDAWGEIERFRALLTLPHPPR